jgi:rfaE bifunctional protein kinase chain/domain
MGSDDSNDLNFSACRVLVMGDVMLDRYWFGDVERVSPEAPIPIVAVKGNEIRAGGAANVAFNIFSLGGQCIMLSVVGDDSAGRDIRALIADSKIEDLIEIDPDFTTTEKLRIVARNQQLLRADFETTPAEAALSRCYDQFLTVVDDIDLIVISDYGKGSLLHIRPIIDIAKRHDVPILVDPKGADFSRYRGASMITPNLREFYLATDNIRFKSESNASDESLIEAKANYLMDEFSIDQILLTLSERGMTLYKKGCEPIHSAARAREVYDVSGAGDTVIAMMALTTALGLPDEQALIYANSAAGVVVSKLGASTVSLAELNAAVLRDSQT